MAGKKQLIAAVLAGALATGIVKNTTSTGVQTIAVAGTDFVAPNTAITGATATKITYDSKGLVTGSSSATASDVGLGNVPNLDTSNAVNDSHTHSNKSILDAITESFTTGLKTTYDSVVNWVSTNGSNLIKSRN